MQGEMTALVKQLKSLTDRDLLQSTKASAEKERKDTLIVLHHLAEVERRRLYTQLGYASLWEYCRKELQYSEPAAHRRISAMRFGKFLRWRPR